MSRTRRSALNFVASTGGSAVGVVVGFVATPLLVRYLGAERLGAFRLATDWAGYLTLLELGLSGALAPLIVQAAATGDRGRVTATLAAGVRAYARVAVWTLLAGAALVVALPALTRTAPDLAGELRVGFALSLAVVLAMPLWVYRPLADALQKGYLISLLLAGQAVISAVGCVSAAYAGWGLVGQFAVTAACQLVVPVSLMIALRRIAPPGGLVRPVGDLAESARRLRGLNRATVVYQLVGRVCLFTDNIVVGLFLGPAAALSLFLTTRLPQAAAGQVQAVGGATWAGLAELYQSGQTDLFRQRLRELTKLTAILAGAVVVPLAALTAPFFALWMRGARNEVPYAGDVVAGLCVLNVVLLAVYSLWGWVFTGTGRVARLLPYMVVQGVLNLGVSLLATWLVGVPGPLIGTAAVNLLYNPVLVVMLKRDYGLSPRQFVGAVCGPLLAAGVVLGGLFAARETWPGYTWVRLGGEFAAAAGGYLVAAWFLLLSAADRDLFRRLFRSGKGATG